MNNTNWSVYNINVVTFMDSRGFSLRLDTFPGFSTHVWNDV